MIFYNLKLQSVVSETQRQGVKWGRLSVFPFCRPMHVETNVHRSWKFAFGCSCSRGIADGSTNKTVAELH
jgi:hypothetical protein